MIQKFFLVSNDSADGNLKSHQIEHANDENIYMIIQSIDNIYTWKEQNHKQG